MNWHPKSGEVEIKKGDSNWQYMWINLRGEYLSLYTNEGGNHLQTMKIDGSAFVFKLKDKAHPSFGLSMCQNNNALIFKINQKQQRDDWVRAFIDCIIISKKKEGQKYFGPFRYLPLEIFSMICTKLEPADIFSVKLVSKAFHLLTETNSFWQSEVIAHYPLETIGHRLNWKKIFKTAFYGKIEENSMWHVTTSEADVRAFDIQFQPDGKLLDYEEGELNEGTNWSKNGKTVTLVFNNYSTWIGTLQMKPKKLNGTASNRDERTWTWSAEIISKPRIPRVKSPH